MIRSRSKKSPAWLAESQSFNELADYNSRKAKGILHTPEYEARMALEQERFNAWIRRDAEESGMVLIDVA